MDNVSEKKKKLGAFIIVPILIIIAFLITAYKRNLVWNNKLDLWKDVVKKSPNKARGYNNRGLVYAEKYQYELAINDYNRSIALISDYSDAYRIYNNRGNAYSQIGQFDRAIGL